MVIGEKFAWGHLGKTGGDAALHLFRLFPELLARADDAETNAKHALFSAHEQAIVGKLLALNLRRLPAWILSYSHHKAKRGLHPAYRPLPMMTADEMARCTAADETLAWFTGNGRFRIDRWLRTEYLRWDFLSFISEFTEVSTERRLKVLQTGAINAAHYEHEVRRWFDAEQIESMYRHNPVWAEIEREIYRDDARISVAQQALNDLIQLTHELGARRNTAEHELHLLKSRLHEATLRAERGPEELRWWLCVERVREKIEQVVPAESHVAIVSKGDDELLALAGRRATHFPQGEGGGFSGHYPADDCSAIQHLEDQRRAGVQFLVFPQTAFWWLEHYHGLRRHLDAVGERICADADCIIYKLAPLTVAAAVRQLEAS